MSYARTIRSATLLGCLACVTAVPVLGQEPILRSVPDGTALTDEQNSLIESASASRALIAVNVANARAHALAREARITLDLGGGTVLTASRTSVRAVAGLGIWHGTVEGPGGQVTLMWWPDGRIAGAVQNQDRFYSIRPIGDGLHAVVALDEARMPPDHAPAVLVSSDRFGQSNNRVRALNAVPPPQDKKKQADAKTGKPTAGAPGDIIIDIIVAYTAKAARNYNDIASDLVELAVEDANQSFRISNLGHVKLRLVHAYQTDYVEDGAAHFDHVWRFADKGDGQLEEIHGLRDQYRADVAILIVDDDQGCGLATRVHADADEAFAVVHHECAALTHSFVHEVGHIIGTRHDRGMDKLMTPFPYGHGYVNGTKWRDIMSYKESCGGCPRLPVWSNPTVLIKGEPAGTPETNNARVIAEQAARVAAFR